MPNEALILFHNFHLMKKYEYMHKEKRKKESKEKKRLVFEMQPLIVYLLSANIIIP